jgi:L-fuculose-phosphate aldolase
MSGIVAAMRRLDALGLNRGSAGNCSVRNSSGFSITPSGVPSESLTEDMLVSMTVSGTVVRVSGTAGTVPDTVTDTLQPSSEWRFHRDLYVNRPDVNAVVHTHSPFATTLACLHRDIPPFHYMIAVAGGDTIRCAPYALFGTQELSDHALKALQGRKACLLANHGMIAVGHDLADAMRIAIEVESLCEQYWRALQIGQPHILSAEEMAQVIEKFKTYGPKAASQ